MSFPHYPNPARRARILEAQQLRMQGLTMRRIARRMHCSVSTVHADLRDYELFRSDLIHELAADQVVDHLIHFAEPDDPQHEQRRADLHELRLLLTALPQIRRDESERSVELLQGGVANPPRPPNPPIPTNPSPSSPNQDRIRQHNLRKPILRSKPTPAIPFLPPLRGGKPAPHLMRGCRRQRGAPRNPRPVPYPKQAIPTEHNRTTPNRNPPQTQPRTAHPPIPTKNHPRPNANRPSTRSSENSRRSSDTETGSRTTPNTTPTTPSASEPSASSPNETTSPHPPRRPKIRCPALDAGPSPRPSTTLTLTT